MKPRLAATDPKETSGTDGRPVNDQAAVVAAPAGTPDTSPVPAGPKDNVNAAGSATGKPTEEPNGNNKPVRRRLRLDELQCDDDVQPRAETNDDLVEEYAERLQAGDEFPPVDVFDDGQEKWVADGFHRHWASEQAGREEIDCLVHRGTKEDAQWFAIRANRSHGLQRSNADKEMAVKKALTHPKGADLSDRQIAEHVSVSHATVIKYRKELESTGQIDQSTRRVGRDGRNIDTARIGNGNQNATGQIDQSTCRVGDDDRSNATGKLYQSTCRVGREGDDAPWGSSNVGFAAEWNAHHERCEQLRRFSEQKLSAADQFVQTAIDNSIDLLLDQVTQQIQDYARMVCTPAVEKNGADPKFVAMLLTKALGENLDH